jgi:hypothetical protein
MAQFHVCVAAAFADPLKPSVVKTYLRIQPYCEQNTTHNYYKDQFVNALQGSNLYLKRD